MQRARTLLLVLAAAVVPSACGGPRIPPPPRPVFIADPEQLAAAFYRRMNAEDLEGVMALMTREPVLVEPFSHPDVPTTHIGYHDVATFFATAFRMRDDQVVPEFMRAEQGGVTVGWSMQGADGTGMSGETRLELRHGLIERVVVQPRE